jgi:hypothetical protein
MATTNFVDGTVIEADWLNDVDAHVYETILVRAWGYVANAGSATLVSGSNVASVVRDAAGAVTVTFTSAMSDANYVVSVAPRNGSACIATIGNVLAGSFSVFTWDAAGVATDSAFYISVIR